VGLFDRLFPPATNALATLDLTTPAPVPTKALSDATVPYERDWTVNWPWQDGAGDIGLVGGYAASYAAMYRRQPWLYAVVNTLSRGIAAMPFKLYLREGNERKRDRDSDLARLLFKPYERMTTFQLIEKLVADTCVYGNAIAIKGLYQDGRPRVFAPMSPRFFQIDRDGDYIHRHPQTGKETGYRRERVYHAAFYNPDDETFGISPMEPLRMTLAIEDAAQRLGQATFNNGARPSSTLSTEQDLKIEKLRELRADVARLYKGVDKTGLPAVLTNGLKWQSMSWDMQQAAVMDFRKLTREEVAAAYHVPPPVVGILDHATFSNITEQNRMLVQHAYRPWAVLIEETIGMQLISDFGDPAAWYGEFDFRDMLKGAPLDQFTAYAQGINAGWITQNEVRELENLPRIDDPDADRLHRPMNLTPAPPKQGGTPNV
jgi:HK97 family phage portal protein